jgi:two-component system response regulator AtoC
MRHTRVLIVEESRATSEFLTELVQLLGFSAQPVRKKTDFLIDLRSLNPDLLLLGTCKHAGQLKALAEVLHREKKGLPVIYIADSPRATEEAQPFDLENSYCLPRSFNPSELKTAMERLIARVWESDMERLDKIIIGQSATMRQVKKHIVRLSKSDVTVLVTGESGTGKELAARAMHDFSSRARNPFVKVNSAAVPGTLLESELFGYEKGAFTGAWLRKPGKFALAQSGSILLDEIGEIPLHVQAKLLQVLDDGELSPLGSTANTKIDVRVFASTNARLDQMVPAGRFRADLYYRLNVVELHIPPLRERKEDLELLCDHFVLKCAPNDGARRDVLSPRAREFFYHHSWPGNVRELENVIKTMAVLGNEECALERLGNQPQSLGASRKRGELIRPERPNPNAPPTVKRPSLKEFCSEAAGEAEARAIGDALEYTRWNRRRSAQLLKISYKALLQKIKKYRIGAGHSPRAARATLAPGEAGQEGISDIHATDCSDDLVEAPSENWPAHKTVSRTFSGRTNS